MIEVECVTCRRVFEAKRSTALFCSNACRQREYRSRTPAKPRPPKPRKPPKHSGHQWARRVEDISASIPCGDFTTDELADALGAAEFLYLMLRGETAIREKRSRG